MFLRHVKVLLTDHRSRPPADWGGCRWWMWRWQQWWCREGWNNWDFSGPLEEEKKSLGFNGLLYIQTITSKMKKKNSPTWHVRTSHDTSAAIKHHSKYCGKGHHGPCSVIHCVVGCKKTEEKYFLLLFPDTRTSSFKPSFQVIKTWI